MSAVKELAVVPSAETALQVFSTTQGLEPWLQQVRNKVDEFLKVLPELNTVKGRESYASMAYQIAKSKTALEAVGKDISAQQKEIPKKIDAERKRVWDTLELWQKEVRKPLDDWQAAEDARIDRHEARIKQFHSLVDVETLFALGIRDKIANVEAVVVDSGFEEFEAEAHRAKATTLASLRESLVKQEKLEADQAELERLRTEAAAQAQRDRDAEIARAAVAEAQRIADQAAEAERQAATKRELALIEQAERIKRDAEQAAKDAEALAANQALQIKLRAEQALNAAALAETNRIAAEQRVEQERVAAAKRQADAVEQAKQAEIDRQAAEVAETQRQARAREDDKAHKMKINRAALEAFIAGGMPEECAKQAVILIAQRKIPAISISY
jgi:colicin import membrane protein